MSEKKKMKTKDDYEFWLRENEKAQILELINDKGTIDVSQISDYFEKSPEEMEEIIKELEEEKLIKSNVGTFYHLTFDGVKRVRRRK